ncbi:Nucleoid-associated protein EspR [Micromonospora sp. MW-13]|uniref:helix-turn-helix domain-containing protein n=1 Tax=Micromonospora sp. MW-13 TaxID=2094022 RepID=UPI000E44D9B1|nr:helix-turn-helix domain-containing protein [Micromonospora sp. MW-13]RGC65016.1 Nucleoid-associated protein EspR [Micromonospora sp. MW-13]
MAGEPRTIADRLNHLFATVQRPDCREYSNEEVAAGITRDQGVPISASYLWYLRTGQRDNPTFRHLNALATFFGVSPAYFFDQETGDRVDAELGVASALRDAGVRTVALRASGLSAASLDAIRDVIDRVRQLEGLPPTDSDPGDRRRA